MRRTRQRKGFLLQLQFFKAGQLSSSSKGLEALIVNSVLEMFGKEKQDFTRVTKIFV